MSSGSGNGRKIGLALILLVVIIGVLLVLEPWNGPNGEGGAGEDNDLPGVPVEYLATFTYHEPENEPKPEIGITVEFPWPRTGDKIWPYRYLEAPDWKILQESDNSVVLKSEDYDVTDASPPGSARPGWKWYGVRGSPAEGCAIGVTDVPLPDGMRLGVEVGAGTGVVLQPGESIQVQYQTKILEENLGKVTLAGAGSYENWITLHYHGLYPNERVYDLSFDAKVRRIDNYELLDNFHPKTQTSPENFWGTGYLYEYVG